MHNSILKKQQKKGLLLDSRERTLEPRVFGSDKKLSKKSLVYNPNELNKQQKNSFSSRTLLAKKIGRKVPRVDCNIDSVLD